MKKPKKQKKPSYKSLAFDLAQHKVENVTLNRSLSDLQTQLVNQARQILEFKGELDSARYARENKMKQLGLYFAALNAFDAGDARLIQLQDELFDRNTHCKADSRSLSDIVRQCNQ